MSTKKKVTSSKEEATPDATAAPESSPVAVADRHDFPDPFGWMGDWIDNWQPTVGRWMPEALRRPIGGMETMRVEQFQSDGDVVVRAELPGVDPEEDIDVSVIGDRLTISARRQKEEKSETDEGFRSEFHYGSFRRTMGLPPGADADDVKANYDDGILEVRVPVNDEVASKTKVPISHK